jgi:hypothetical protein
LFSPPTILDPSSAIFRNAKISGHHLILAVCSAMTCGADACIQMVSSVTKREFWRNQQDCFADLVRDYIGLREHSALAGNEANAAEFQY